MRVLELKWLWRNDNGPLDLIKMIDKLRNNAILNSRFVDILLNCYWAENKKKILYTMFLPSIFFHLAMIQFMLIFLSYEVRSHKYFDVFYYPSLGIVLMLFANQLMTEIIQFKGSKGIRQYLFNIWNIIDLA